MWESCQKLTLDRFLLLQMDYREPDTRVNLAKTLKSYSLIKLINTFL